MAWAQRFLSQARVAAAPFSVTQTDTLPSGGVLDSEARRYRCPVELGGCGKSLGYRELPFEVRCRRCGGRFRFRQEGVGELTVQRIGARLVAAE